MEMQTTSRKELELRGRIAVVRQNVRKVRRVVRILYFMFGGFVTSFVAIMVSVLMTPRGVPPVEMYGMLPLVGLLVTFGVAMLVCGWMVRTSWDNILEMTGDERGSSGRSEEVS
ncbi:MAG: hypothetical protein ACYC6X_03360 [Minisyncoccota bacterium]